MRSGRSLCGAWVLVVLSAAPVVAAQQPQPPAPAPEINNDSDPTRPVFLSARPEYYNLPNGVERQVLIGRFDAGLLRNRPLPGAKTGILLRFEVPLARTDTGSDSATGLGDLYGQFLLVPYATRKFAWVVGSGFLLDTATDDLLGSGKWVVAPVAAPLWRLNRGLFFVKLQNFTSFAGDEQAADINYFLVTPTLIHGVGRDWWVLADTETKSDWNADGRTGVKSGFQVGRRVTTGLGLWVKPEVWWAANRDGDWNLKFGLVWYQRR